MSPAARGSARRRRRAARSRGCWRLPVETASLALVAAVELLEQLPAGPELAMAYDASSAE